MSTLPKEVLRGMISYGNLTTVGDIHSYLKDVFKDVFKDALQEMLEAELEYSKGDIRNRIIPRDGK